MPIDRFEFMTLQELKRECRRLESSWDEINLYEVTNGQRTDKGFIRVYCWCAGTEEAAALALQAFRYDGMPTTPGKLRVQQLFCRGAPPFVTRPSPDGFDFTRPRNVVEGVLEPEPEADG